jgi:spore germination protein GerM
VRRLGTAGLLFALAACGVPSDSGPRALPRDRVPFDLLTPGSSVATTTTLVAVTTDVPIALIGPDRVAVVHRLVGAPPSLFRVIEALLAGPTAEESALGLRTAIINQTRLLSVRIQGGVATIDLSGDFAAIGGTEQILALAQLVFTATGAAGVLGVRLSLDGKAVELPRGDGTLTQEPLRPRDYAAIAPDPAG